VASNSLVGMAQLCRLHNYSHRIYGKVLNSRDNDGLSCSHWSLSFPYLSKRLCSNQLRVLHTITKVTVFNQTSYYSRFQTFRSRIPNAMNGLRDMSIDFIKGSSIYAQSHFCRHIQSLTRYSIPRMFPYYTVLYQKCDDMGNVLRDIHKQFILSGRYY
jgi:hypothetical protein